jgi:uncharacterized protein (TIGR02646 family)
VRYVHYPATAVSAEWLKRAGKAAATAAGKTSAAEAAAYIKSRGAVWTALKETLEALSDRKCWYSEARDSVSHWQVDHYRPKSIYPWLAFTWHNLRLCGGKPNQRKSNEFPLAAGCARGSVTSGVRGETPLLLDPTRLGDPELLTFKADGEPVCAQPADPVATERVAISVKLLDLDSEALCEERRRKWRACEEKLRRLRELLQDSRQQANEDGSGFVDEVCLDLQKLYADDAVFTATAKACAQELNSSELVEIALRRARAIA